MSHGIQLLVFGGFILGAGLSAQAQVPAGDVVNGKRIFMQRCTQCHSIEEGGQNKTGNRLFGIMGKKSGEVPGFDYSAAMKNKGITWNDMTMFDFLLSPQKYVPGNKMVFAGLKDPQGRADLIAYMKTFSPAPDTSEQDGN